MIIVKTYEEIELIRKSSLLVGKALAEVGRQIKPGVTTASLDKTAETFIRDHGGIPAFLNYRGYPATLCISINAEVVHGIPSPSRIIAEGDIVSVDCGVLMNGFYGDSAFTFTAGNIRPEYMKLLQTTREALYKGIEQATEGKRIGDVGYAVQSHCETAGFSVVREMVGHGVGKNLHESPEVPNYGRRGAGTRLREGMVIAIEPMINFGKKEITIGRDGWTITAADNLPSAHFEHTVAVGRDNADILSSFEWIDEYLIK